MKMILLIVMKVIHGIMKMWSSMEMQNMWRKLKMLNMLLSCINMILIDDGNNDYEANMDGYSSDHSIFNDNIVQDEVMEDEKQLDESNEQSSRKISSKTLLSYKEHSNNQWKEPLETNI